MTTRRKTTTAPLTTTHPPPALPTPVRPRVASLTADRACSWTCQNTLPSPPLLAVTTTPPHGGPGPAHALSLPAARGRCSRVGAGRPRHGLSPPHRRAARGHRCAASPHAWSSPHPVATSRPPRSVGPRPPPSDPCPPCGPFPRCGHSPQAATAAPGPSSPPPHCGHSTTGTTAPPHISPGTQPAHRPAPRLDRSVVLMLLDDSEQKCGKSSSKVAPRKKHARAAYPIVGNYPKIMIHLPLMNQTALLIACLTSHPGEAY